MAKEFCELRSAIERLAGGNEWPSDGDDVVQRCMKTLLASRCPVNTARNFVARRVAGRDGMGNTIVRLLSTAREPNRLHSSLMGVDVIVPAQDVLQLHGTLPAYYTWHVICTAEELEVSNVSKEEELMRERKRQVTSGISDFAAQEYGMGDNGPPTIIIPSSTKIYVCRWGKANDDIDHRLLHSGTAMVDHTLSQDGKFTSYVEDNNLNVVHVPTGNHICLTEAKEGISFGTATFLFQEEFDLYTGHWWSPVVKRRHCSDCRIALSEGVCKHCEDVYHILFMEVDQSEVGEVWITGHDAGAKSEQFKYPRAGESNPKIRLWIGEISVSAAMPSISCSLKLLEHVEEAERISGGWEWQYTPRCGWTPQGDVWVWALDRRQRRGVFVTFNMTFATTDESTQKTSEAVEETTRKQCSDRVTVWRRESTDAWINVNDLVYFFKTQNAMIIGSEMGLSGVWGSQLAKSDVMKKYHGNEKDDAVMDDADGDQDEPMEWEDLNYHGLEDSKPERITGVDDKQKMFADADSVDGNSSDPPSTTDLDDASGFRQGFNHLYMLQQDEKGEITTTQITSGMWQVSKTFLCVDEKRSLIYFTGTRHTPLETHLYVTSYLPKYIGQVVHLSPPGCSCEVTMVDDNTLFVLTMSSVTSPPCTILFSIVFNNSDVYESKLSDVIHAVPVASVRVRGQLQAWPTGKEAPGRWWRVLGKGEAKTPGASEGKDAVNPESLTSLHEALCLTSRGPPQFVRAEMLTPSLKALASALPFPINPPTLFSFSCPVTNSRAIGWVFIPPTRKGPHPTLLWVYGGPQVQLVSNSFAPFNAYLHLQLLAALGFAVVMVDGVGSANRGLAFEAGIRRCLGQVEVFSQMQGLRALVDEGIVDRDRIAVAGSSYGGYLSLMFLALRPDVFKVAISSSPVTMWEAYDTAYTERYLDLPSLNPIGYRKGCVHRYVSSFPSTRGRLLIMHGVMDENVHLCHTMELVDRLIKAEVPYDLVLFPRERHGVREWASYVHQEVSMLHRLLKLLQL